MFCSGPQPNLNTMKRLIPAFAALVLITGCASSNPESRAAARGALVGAAGGALVSSMSGGDPWAGAAVGAAGGAAVGYIAADGKQRRVERDRNGRSYWVDDHGRRRYVDSGY